MIKNKDRAFWFGASDTHYIMGNWDTRTFRRWWLVKLGVTENRFGNVYTEAGNAYEHRIADCYLQGCRKDRQIKIRALRLRVNLDAEYGKYNIEIKTVKHKLSKPAKAHIMQVQVQMFASGLRETRLVYYKLNEDDYSNFFNDIDRTRIVAFPIQYDEDFVNNEYLPRLRILNHCLRKGIMPCEDYMRPSEIEYGLRDGLYDITASRLARKQERRKEADNRGRGEAIR